MYSALFAKGWQVGISYEGLRIGEEVTLSSVSGSTTNQTLFAFSSLHSFTYAKYDLSCIAASCFYLGYALSL